MKSLIFFDNRRPDREDYPNFEPREISDDLLQVEIGQYIVNRDGDIMIATTSNKKYFESNEFYNTINAPYFRAKYLGNKDDSLEYANQCRLATKEEIDSANALTFEELSFKIDNTGQLLLV